jgi:FtsP/CotA-like multicopper oxidase with cupredoxin domain
MRRATRSFAALAICLLGAAVALSCNSSGSKANNPGANQLAILAPPGSTVSEVCLRVDSYTLQPGAVGNTDPIVMWGYVPTGSGAGCGFSGAAPDGTRAVVPTIEAAEGSYLNVHLQNNLSGGPSAFVEPVSIIASGQAFFGSDAPGSPGPTWTDGTTGPRNTSLDVPQRVRSFTVEAPPASGGGPVITYSFGPLRAGTYVLQSGTHPGVQVQMGLAATLIVRPAASGRAYLDPSTVFDSELVLHFSEIDPVLHGSVGAGHYGSPAPDPAPADWMTSPTDHHPRFFLVNGKPYSAGAAAVASVPRNSRLLLRMLNSGMETRVPVAGGRYLSLVAEDGNLYVATSSKGSCPAPRRQFAVLLPAGKTVDGILETPSSGNSLAVYDRRGNVTNAGAWPGGLLATLTLQAGASSPPGPAVGPCALTGP